MRILKETNGAWWVYDGLNHGLYLLLATGVGKLIGLQLKWLLLIYILGVLLFIVLEIFQELAMVKVNKKRKFHFSQRRWQDILFPVFLGAIPFITYGFNQ